MLFYDFTTLLTSRQACLRGRKREGERTTPNNKGMLSITPSCCSPLSHLPVVVCVITPQLKCLCSVTVCVCVTMCASRFLVTTLSHVNNVAWTEGAISHKCARVLRKKKKGKVDKTTNHFYIAVRWSRFFRSAFLQLSLSLHTPISMNPNRLYPLPGLPSSCLSFV